MKTAGSYIFSHGFDLPCYRVNNFKTNFRGVMAKKKKSLVSESKEDDEEDEAALAAKQTTEWLKGRTCVVQILASAPLTNDQNLYVCRS